MPLDLVTSLFFNVQIKCVVFIYRRHQCTGGNCAYHILRLSSLSSARGQMKNEGIENNLWYSNK
jgi:hypothetical protein